MQGSMRGSLASPTNSIQSQGKSKQLTVVSLFSPMNPKLHSHLKNYGCFSADKNKKYDEEKDEKIDKNLIGFTSDDQNSTPKNKKK